MNGKQSRNLRAQAKLIDDTPNSYNAPEPIRNEKGQVVKWFPRTLKDGFTKVYRELKRGYKVR